MLVTPTFIVEDITLLDLEQVSRVGIRGFILDLDNTIMAPRTGILEESMRQWLMSVDASGIRCICVSNNKRLNYCEAAEKTIGMPVIGCAGKPFRKNLIRAVNLLDLKPHQVAVVGDRPLTDILGGAWIGAHTILVDPLTKELEHDMIKFLRRLERLVIRTPNA